MSYPASPRRLLAAWLIDLLFFWTVLIGLSQLVSSPYFQPHWVWLAPFYVLRHFLAAISTTPGLSTLSIDMHDKVPAAIAINEDLFSIGLPLVMMVLGSIVLVSPATPGSILPVMGLDGDPSSKPFVGFFLIGAAVALLRQLMLARILSAIFFALALVSVAANLSALDAYVTDMLVTNRVADGFIAQPEDVATMQWLLRIVLFGVPALSLIILLTPAAKREELADLANEPSDQSLPRPFHQIPTDRRHYGDLPGRMHG
ncbi:MAG: hypothetical protein H6851_11700 [Geminicoccaceae bacterium]|nr:hypothetical protein [Geminicoccaceae bacterium]MCB9944267.1 hypothetical protein [Geminicoccaceae bacterium]